MQKVDITVAYEPDLEFALDRSSGGTSLLEALEDLHRLAAEDQDWNRLTDDEAARIIRSAAALIERQVGTVGECLDTALVWERG